jgi:hypothetical protein
MAHMDKDIEQLVEDVRTGKLNEETLKTRLDEVAEAAAEKALEPQEVDLVTRQHIDRLARKASRL